MMTIFHFLGATSPLVPELFKVKVLKRDFQLPTIMGVWRGQILAFLNYMISKRSTT